MSRDVIDTGTSSSLRLGHQARTTAPGGRSCINHITAQQRPLARCPITTLDQGCLCGHSGQKPRARREPARTGRGPSPARCGSPCYRTACAELTATVTATAATNGKRQRPATAPYARTPRGDLALRPALADGRAAAPLRRAPGLRITSVPPRCPRTATNSQRPPPAAPCKPEASADFEPASNAREHPRNA